MLTLRSVGYESYSASLLDRGRDELARSRQVIARSQWLGQTTRDLLLTYRAHRFRPMLGASDTNGDQSEAEEVQNLADDLVARTPLPDTSAARPPRGMLGGLARAAKLTPEQRQEIARKAAAARWERFRNGVGTGPPEARLGGLARARALTPERRKDIARQASQAMWERMKATRRDPDPE